MSRRIPLLATLVPLIVGLLGYYYWWNGERDRFAEELGRFLGRETPVEVGGFPYRLEADFGAMALSRITPLVTLRLSVDRLAVNRAPIGRPLTVIGMGKPVAAVGLGGIAASHVRVAALTARTSLRLAPGGRIARLSTVFDQATIRAAAFAVPARADGLEVHVRETPQALDPASRAPTYPEQAQVVVEAGGVRYAGGDRLGLSAQFGIDARAPLRGTRAVLAGATLELGKLQLSDAHGIVATMAATASPDSSGNVLVSGTVDTICPANVVALLAGRPGVRELRNRLPQRLSFSGPLGAVVSSAPATGVPVRSQEPPCPVLRR